MSDLFLTSAGLELGDIDNNTSPNEITVQVENVVGNLVKFQLGDKPYVRFLTDDLYNAFCLANKQITQAVVKYNSETCIINFSSYNYMIEKSLGKAIITIEGSDVKK